MYPNLHSPFWIKVSFLMIIDLHVHTTNRSSDSSLSTQELIDEALRIGLQGACLTEHGGLWDAFEFERIIGDTRGVVLIPAIEVSTDMGHVTVFGLERYTSGISKLLRWRIPGTAMTRICSRGRLLVTSVNLWSGVVTLILSTDLVHARRSSTVRYLPLKVSWKHYAEGTSIPLRG